MARGRAAQVLCDYSRTADMVVVGARGQDGLTGLRLGSVPWQLAGHAHSPVVVIRGAWLPVNQSPGPVVAGVDGSAASGAQFVVIGARGRGGVPGLHLGSVAHIMLHHAPCPVAIVRERTL